VPIQRAKPVETLYDEVAGYDLVLTPDAPLASAINRRLDVLHFGTFATTPRRLAAGRREQAEDRSVSRSRRPDRPRLEIRQLRRREHAPVLGAPGSIESILAYDAYVDDATEAVVDIMADLRSTSKRLTEYTIEADPVAVVGEDRNHRTRTLYPPGGVRPVRPVHRRGLLSTRRSTSSSPRRTSSTPSSRRSTRRRPTTSRWSSTATVATLLARRSAFEAVDVPYYGGPGFVDDPHHRSLLCLCRTAFRGRRRSSPTSGRSSRRWASTSLSTTTTKRLHALDVPETEWIQAFCSTLESWTFGECLAEYMSPRRARRWTCSGTNSPSSGSPKPG